MNMDDRVERVVEARVKLRARFLRDVEWISKIEVLERDHPGFWEQRGYSNTAYPWRKDRYSR
jgi:DMSO/TMAO reductase YedYZ molybdopterin-dependent catalytic subunit